MRDISTEKGLGMVRIDANPSHFIPRSPCQSNEIGSDRNKSNSDGNDTEQNHQPQGQMAPDRC